MEWYRNLRIVLSVEDKLPYLEQPILALPVSPAGQIQKTLEHLGAFDMLKELKTLYVQQADQELLQTLHEQTLPQEISCTCSSCYKGRKGHWRRNYPIYLAELMKKKKLSQGASTSGVEAIGEFYLCLPSGLVLILQNCHYALSITRGIVSVSRFYNDGFDNRFENDNSISVSKNNLIYFNAILRDDIYEIVLSSSNTNDSSMYVVSNKRAKLNLDSALL
ncbi:hypothetical protein Tco_1291276 [Tanacetum coccineum]